MVPCGAGEAATCLVSWAWEPMSTTTYLYGLEASPMPWPWRQAISTPASCTTTAAFAAGVTAKTASLVTGEIRYCSRPIRYSKPGHEGPPRPRRPTYLVASSRRADDMAGESASKHNVIGLAIALQSDVAAVRTISRGSGARATDVVNEARTRNTAATREGFVAT